MLGSAEDLLANLNLKRKKRKIIIWCAEICIKLVGGNVSKKKKNDRNPGKRLMVAKIQHIRDGNMVFEI